MLLSISQRPPLPFTLLPHHSFPPPNHNKSIKKMMTSRNLTALGRAGKGFRPKARAAGKRSTVQPPPATLNCSLERTKQHFARFQEPSSNGFYSGPCCSVLWRFFGGEGKMAFFFSFCLLSGAVGVDA